jgi:pseudouridylate synthase
VTVDQWMTVREDVAAALVAQASVVGLESTMIAHGLPRPHNLDTALEMEAAVREAGALPATIGIVDGKIVVGLSAEQIGRIADSADVAKVSSADFAAVLTSGRLGATTVAGTVYAAARAGIRVMATGGIGGAHRGSENTFDISADLTEMARTPVAVVCAGAKAILDLPRTVEVLETLGIPVVGFGTDEFPAFYSRESGLPLQHRVDSADEAGKLMCIHWDLGWLGQGTTAGILIEVAMRRGEVEGLVSAALVAAEAAGIRGKGVTPFLLGQLAEKSGGRTLKANIALLKANARLAGGIAAAYCARKAGRW